MHLQGAHGKRGGEEGSPTKRGWSGQQWTSPGRALRPLMAAKTVVGCQAEREIEKEGVR